MSKKLFYGFCKIIWMNLNSNYSSSFIFFPLRSIVITIVNPTEIAIIIEIMGGTLIPISMQLIKCVKKVELPINPQITPKLPYNKLFFFFSFTLLRIQHGFTSYFITTYPGFLKCLFPCDSRGSITCLSRKLPAPFIKSRNNLL